MHKHTDTHWWVSWTGPDLTSGRWRLMHPLWVTGWGIEGQRASLIKSLTGAIQAFWTTAAPTTHTHTHRHPLRHKHKASLKQTCTHSSLSQPSLSFLLFLPHALFQLSSPALSTSRLNHALPELKLIPQSQAAGTKIRKSIGRLAGLPILTDYGSFPFSFVGALELNGPNRGQALWSFIIIYQ